MGSIFSKPKMPTPQVVKAPAITDTANQDALMAERKRRQMAIGSQGNIVSSLVGASSDIASKTKKSTLLGG